MYRFDWPNNGLVSRGWYCDEAIVRLVQLCFYSWLAMWKKLYMMKKKSLSKLLRRLFKWSYINITYKRTNCIKKKYTSQMAKKWMRLKMFQLTHIYIYIYKLTSCWSVVNNWSYVDSLGLNACKWVALRTGMNLFLWCGLVLFRLDETTNICIQHI